MAHAPIPEIIDGLPNICGWEEQVAEVTSGKAPVFLNDTNLRLDRINSCFSIALHMQQPLIPVGGNDIRTADLISNLDHMFRNQGTGDNHNATLPQDPQRLGGKVLRIDRDGAAAPGNNVPAGFDARIFTYGHRNVQGIAFRPGTGQPFASEHGPNHSDEVTPLAAGGNAGWDPQNRPGLTCPDNYCGYAGNASTMPMTDTVRFPNALRPSWTNNGVSQGMGPCTFLTGSQWRDWNGRLAVGIMGANRLVILQLDSAGMTTSAVNASIAAARYRSLVQGPDGNLYIATDGGEIWHVVPN